MFGLNKLKEAKEKAVQMKAALSQLDFEGKSQNGMVSIQCSGDKRFHNLEINDSIFKICDLSEEERTKKIFEVIDLIEQEKKEQKEKKNTN